MGVGVSLAPGTSSRAPGHLLLPPVAGLHPAGDQTSVPTWRAVCCWLVDIQKLPLVCTHPGKLLTGLSILTVMPRRGPMWRLPPLWAVSLFWRREERPPCLPLRGEGGHQWPCGLCEVPGLDCLTCLGFPCLVLILMLEAQPLCTRAKRNLRDRVLGDVEKNSFIPLSGKGGHSSLMPSSLCAPTQEDLVRSCRAAAQGWSCC